MTDVDTILLKTGRFWPWEVWAERLTDDDIEILLQRSNTALAYLDGNISLHQYRFLIGLPLDKV